MIPLAPKGIAYRPIGAAALLRRNLLVCGLGGLIVPFVGIKCSQFCGVPLVQLDQERHRSAAVSENCCELINGVRRRLHMF